jgi:hypothetical protein
MVEAGSASPSRSALALRRKSRRVSPSGPRLRRPVSEGPPNAAVYLLPCGPGRAPTGGFRRDSCRAKTAGHPWPAPCGPCPAEALACATGPEGETRRLFRSLRFVGSSAPLVIRRATVLSSAIRAAQATRATPPRGKDRATRDFRSLAHTRLTLLSAGATTAPDGNNPKVNGQGKAATGNNEKRRAKSDQQAADSKP